MTKLSRGVRNNNPGNIRHSVTPFRGEVTPSGDAEFKEFESMEWGFRAMLLILHNYGVLYGIDTLDRMIYRWSPPSENDTALYIKAIARRLDCTVGAHIDTLNRDVMVAMVGAMAHIECGVAMDEATIERGWELFATGVGCDI